VARIGTFPAGRGSLGSVFVAALLTVVSVDEPDETFEFRDDGQALRFGRDDTQCDLVVWSAVNGRELSRVAGRIWRMEGELWLRNLSTRHELYVETPTGPPPPPLRPRQPIAEDPGPACSIPAPLAVVRGPAGCELLVRQRLAAEALPPAPDGSDTVRVPPVPDHLRPIAAALCEPLLLGGHLPATYHEIAQRTGTPPGKRVRNLVTELCQPYLAEVPQLRQRIAERQQREEAELAAGRPTLHGGVWRFGGSPVPGPADQLRRRALALPDYYEIAHLLVRRRLITAADVARLPVPR
jgi:hypothetical protein